MILITEKLNKNVKSVETDLCATLYRYVKSLVDKCDENEKEITTQTKDYP
ncbi:MAG: hypothetical protein DSM107014_14570 [Gomphosphaeria aponina SAG 52.96 = DSM 107014]|uniref:Uncharacterized protein n=1 Tax=Gomphosphaeria aponina SAG 52.96 = DSM 107014 TaxID=1521640 RepID=A0A941GWN0_9CHRO|nr:hypothetical protein [Gomphosphaeria aponina SAG 52.96 = DSM 107014]